MSIHNTMEPPIVTKTHYEIKFAKNTLQLEFKCLHYLYNIKGTKPDWKYDENGVYYLIKDDKQYLADIIYTKKGYGFYYRDDNPFNLRQSNIKYIKGRKKDKNIPDFEPDDTEYEILEYTGGYMPKEGMNNGRLCNPSWTVKDKSEDIYCLLCIDNDKNLWCKIDIENLLLIRSYHWVTFNKQPTAFIDGYMTYMKDYLVQNIFKEKYKEVKFISTNQYDCRAKNIKIIYEEEIDTTDKEYFGECQKSEFKERFPDPDSGRYNILEYGEPITRTKGASAGQERNMYWKVYDMELDDTYYMMYASGGSKFDDVYFKFSEDCYDKVLNYFGYRPIWYYKEVGYIATSTLHSERKVYYLHQIIMDHYGNGKGQHSVDHINQDKLDNRKSNLRIVDQGDQNRNRGKRSRNKNAKPIPKELDGIILPRYVIYYHEITNKKTGAWREFFKIEKHPGCPPNKSGKKIWIGTKSKKVSITDKLKIASAKCKEFDQNI